MIYVDKAFKWESRKCARARWVGAFTGHTWCHMWSSTGDMDELHAFAKRIGLKRAWFQKHRVLYHYDLTPSRRAKAIQLGARETSLYKYLSYQRMLEIT